MAVIGWDIDDTVADGASVFVPYQNEFFGVNVTVEELGSALAGQRMHEVYKTTPEKFEQYVYDSGPILLPKLKPVEGAVEVVNALYDAGHTIYFVTARPIENTKEITINWLNSNGFKYHGVRHSKTKIEVCEELGIEIFVDDYVKVINNLNSFGIKSILVDIPKNKEVQVNDGVYKAKTPKDAYKIIQELI